MEYERALYRVYERCLDGFSGGPNASSTVKVLRVCQSLSFAGSLLFLVILTHLHLAFVNQPSCLPVLLNNAMNTTSYSLRRDHIVQINVDSKFAPVLPTFDSKGNVDLLRLLTPTNHSGKVDNSTVKPDYEYAQLSSVLALPNGLRESHAFTLINVSMTGEDCFGSSVTQALLPFGGVDTAILNAVKTTTHHSGFLKSSINAYYHWTKDELKPPSRFSDILLRKLGILLGSCLAFFLLSTVTALLIRVLISSGVVLLFPLFWSLQCCGIHIFNSRIISLSYPWIGLPLEMLRARNQRTGPFIMGHIVRVLIYYFLYEASQIAISIWFYHHSFPGPRELCWEYFTMIYVRSSLAISFFPRASFLLFLLYHFYLYSFPSGFHLLALLVLFLALNWLMMITLLKIELPAYIRGDVSFEQPRAIFNALPWPAWTVALGPDFSLFMPVQYRSSSVYDAQPQAPPDNAAPLPAPPADLQEPPDRSTRSQRYTPAGSYERLETDESEDIESYQRQIPVRNPLMLSSDIDLELGEMSDRSSRRG